MYTVSDLSEYAKGNLEHLKHGITDFWGENAAVGNVEVQHLHHGGCFTVHFSAVGFSLAVECEASCCTFYFETESGPKYLITLTNEEPAIGFESCSAENIRRNLAVIDQTIKENPDLKQVREF
ncbi:MAG: hypothetical protein LBO63_00680 [Oscillospiraceae bacterium]|nr:hypothetical protein [Oscillospiraceae bacterium]